MKKVLVTTSSFGKAVSKPLDRLREFCEVKLNPYGRKLTTEEFIELSTDADGVIAGVEQITRAALEARRNIKVISRCGVGMDNVDISACDELGIKVYNTPVAPVDSVAELTVTLTLDILKNVSNMNSSIKCGKWSKMTGSLLKKIGIIGMGRIGRRVAELLSAFETEIVYTDIETKDVPYKFKSKDELLSYVDVLTIHSSGQGDSGYLIGERELSLMKKEAYLINSSRGKYIDEEALYHALKADRLAGAALDVFGEEPYFGKLTELDNVILTPHIASSAKEGRAIMEMEAVENLLIGLGIIND